MTTFRTKTLLAMPLVLSLATLARGQSSVRPTSDTMPSMIDPGTIVGPSFTQPTRPVNPAFSRSLGGCLAVFKREMTVYSHDHPRDVTSAHDTLLRYERLRARFPASAITAGRNCYRAVYPTPSAVANEDLATLWPLAVAANDDTLARELSARQLTYLGSGAHADVSAGMGGMGDPMQGGMQGGMRTSANAQAAWLARVVRGLVESSPMDGRMHLTDAHVAMARQALTQLEAMGPAHVAQWMNARVVFDNAVNEALSLASDTAVQAAIDDDRHVIDFLRTIPRDSLSAPDRKRAADLTENKQVYGVARLTYLKTLDPADLARYAHLVDSTWGGTRPWLVGRRAPALAADYWFGTPGRTGHGAGGTAPAELPASGAVSLIMFVSPEVGRPATHDMEKDAMLRRLHAMYPSLQIILMTVTKGYWANESLLGHPEREARRMYDYVHDSLKVPGIMGVLTGKQRSVTTDGHMIAVQLPLLDEYMVDVSFLRGLVFVVNRQGLVVDQGMEVVPIISRLLDQSVSPKAEHATSP